MSITAAVKETIRGWIGAAAAADPPQASSRPKFHSHKVNASQGYDSASSTRENWRHFRWSDYLSADASMRADVRRTVRARARYEVLRNNSIGLGMVLTLVNDTIGVGPRLHMGLKNEKFNDKIQKAWAEWAHAICLPDKLHTMKKAKVIDGEAVARIAVNMNLETPISLDLQLVECDRLEAPFHADDLSPNYVDGIHLDSHGYPVAYDVLRYHPGDEFATSSFYEYDTYDQRNILHWYRVDRPEQHRGISEVQSALNLFALLRRFTLATVTAAETAANISMVLRTNEPTPDDFEVDGESSDDLMGAFWMQSVQLDRNAATVLPHGWDINQIISQHPSTTYGMFKHELIAEIARCLTMPYNIAAANSSEHNYASGRLDHQTYHSAITVERDGIDRLILDRLFNEWMHEAALTGVLPKSVANKVLDTIDKSGANNISRVFKHTWHWPGFAHSDPVKEASATNIRLSNGTTHREREYAKEGRDIDVEDAIAAEKLGMPLEEYRRMIAISTYFNGNAFAMMDETGPETVERSATEETAEGGGALTNEPPQLKQANEQRRLRKQLEQEQQQQTNAGFHRNTALRDAIHSAVINPN